MFSKVLGFLFFMAIIAIVATNFQNLLSFGQEHLVYTSAEKAMEASRWEQAIDVYRTGLRQYPDNIAVALKLGWLYERNNQPEQAERVYRNILDKHADNLEARIGLVNVMKRDPLRQNEAVDELRKALKTHPQDAILLNQIGNLYKNAAANPQETRPHIRKWLYDQARYYYQLSLKLDPRPFQTHFNLGVAMQNMGQRQQAAQAYCKAIIAHPDSYEARFNLGMILSDMNYLDEAYRQMDRAVQILSEQGNIDNARRVAQKVQDVKNSVYQNTKLQGLTTQPTPPFLDPKCLYNPLTTAKHT